MALPITTPHVETKVVTGKAKCMVVVEGEEGKMMVVEEARTEGKTVVEEEEGKMVVVEEEGKMVV